MVLFFRDGGVIFVWVTAVSFFLLSNTFAEYAHTASLLPNQRQAGAQLCRFIKAGTQ
jgi:hypothetical protein